MLIPQKNRKLIYEVLFKEGILVAKKDFNAPRHSEINVPNLQVIKALQSLDSRGYVKTRFSWQYYYYTLTDEGINYLREYLYLPEAIVPATHKKVERPSQPRSGEWESERAPRGDRDDYRRRDDSKKEGASGDYKPEFRGAYGRAPAPAAH